MGPLRLLLCASLLAATLAAGCGDKGAVEVGSGSEADREAVERGQAAAAVPAADLTAYYRLSTATGTLRGFAAALATGGPDAPGPGDAELRRTAQAVAALQPEDRQLARLRPELRSALARAVKTHTQAQARRLLRRASALTHALARYARRVPEAAGAVLPD